jgi:hypothetical protein
MGGAASVEGLGESSGAFTLIQECWNRRSILGNHTRSLLNAQKIRTFKDHESIINAVCTHHTKKSLADNVLNETLSISDLEELAGAGTQYSLWLSRLPYTEFDLKVYDLSIACHGTGIDSAVIGNILATSTPNEIAGLRVELKSNHEIDIVALIKNSLTDGSPLQHCLLELLSTGETVIQSVNGDENAARTCAKVMVDMELPALITCIISLDPDYLNSVSTALENHEQTSLTNLLDTKAGDKLRVRNLLRVITAPDTVSKVGELTIQLATGSAEQCIQLLTRYDSAFHANVSEYIHAKTGKNTLETLSGFLKGKLALIASKWMHVDSSILSTENAVHALHAEYTGQGLSWEGILADSEKAEAMMAALTLARDALQAIVNDLPAAQPGLSIDVADTGLNGQDSPSPETMSPTTAAVVSRYKSLKFSSNNEKGTDGESFNSKLDLVSRYLTDIFATADVDSDGYLPHYKFWSVFSDLNVAKMCYEVAEIENMPEMTFKDFVIDGNVYYDEAIPEMADDMISGLESHGHVVRATIEAEIESASHEELENVYKEAQEETGYDAVADPPLPPDIMTHLENTFSTFDVEKKGYLSREDFWYLVQMLHLDIQTQTGSELDAQVAAFDTSGDGKIEWAEALPRFSQIIHDLASDLRDHWIGLEDTTQNPPMGFWYNLLDGASQWMTTEELEAYLHKDKSDAKASKGPSIKSKFVSKVGLIASINRLKKSISAHKSRKAELESDESIDPVQKAELMAKLEIDYTTDVDSLKKQQEEAKKVLQQRLDATKTANAKKLRERLDKKKRRSHK